MTLGEVAVVPWGGAVDDVGGMELDGMSID